MKVEKIDTWNNGKEKKYIDREREVESFIDR